MQYMSTRDDCDACERNKSGLPSYGPKCKICSKCHHFKYIVQNGINTWEIRHYLSAMPLVIHSIKVSLRFEVMHHDRWSHVTEVKDDFSKLHDTGLVSLFLAEKSPHTWLQLLTVESVSLCRWGVRRTWIWNSVTIWDRHHYSVWIVARIFVT
jgi:hypothetical protein